MMKIKIVLSTVALLVTCANAQVSMSQASIMKRQIDTMCSDFTDTMVIPTAQPDALLLVSMKVLQTTQSRNVWTLIGAASAAKANINVKEIWFSDVASMRGTEPYALVLSMGVAKSVQERLHSGAINLEQGFSEIQRNLTKKVIKKT
jgi:hypothetical protein